MVTGIVIVILMAGGVYCFYGQPDADLKTYRYAYQQHPLDDKKQVFSVQATTQERADRLAKLEFERMFINNQTVMTVFYRD